MDESNKSKAALRAERRAKQEAQRAAKQTTAQAQEKEVKPKDTEPSGKSEPEKIKKVKNNNQFANIVSQKHGINLNMFIVLWGCGARQKLTFQQT